MAEQKSAADQELDDEGNPITPADEGGRKPPIKSKTDEGEAEPDAVVPVRKSAEQHIIARQKRTIDKLRSRDEDDEEGDKPSAKEDEGKEEDELTPEAQTAVQREVSRAMSPLVKSLASKADEDELQDLFNSDPESHKYEKRIRAYMGHGQYKGVPPSVIFHHLAFDDAETTGARRKRLADTEAGQSRGGGGRTTRPTASGTGVPTVDEQNEMTDAEFEELQNRARVGEFVEGENK